MTWAVLSLGLAFAIVWAGDRLLGGLLYILIGGACVVLLLGERRGNPSTECRLARLAGIGALILSSVALASLWLTSMLPALVQDITLARGLNLDPIPIHMARASVVLIMFAAFASWQLGHGRTGRPARVAAVLAAAVVWMVPGVAGDLAAEASGNCKAAMRSLVSALDVYLAASDGRYPPKDDWFDAVVPSSAEHKRIRCPVASRTQGSFAFNSALAGVRRDAIENPRWLVVFFESDAVGDASRGPELVPEKPRHLGGTDNYAFADGRVESILRERVGTTPRRTPIYARMPDPEVPVTWTPVLKEPRRAPAEQTKAHRPGAIP